jgi:hypothetical protein
MAEALGMMHELGRVLLLGLLWPVDPKLVFDQMAAPMLEIMDDSLHISSIRTVLKRYLCSKCSNQIFVHISSVLQQYCMLFKIFLDVTVLTVEHRQAE